MLIVLPFFSGDVHLARRNLEWMAELDTSIDYDCILSCDSQTDSAPVRELAECLFRAVRVIQYPRATHNGRVIEKWPWQQNNAFAQTARWMARNGNKQPWLWLETDATPIHPGWAQMLETEYLKGGKPFGGHLSDKKVFNGVAIYPYNVAHYSVDAINVSMRYHERTLDQEPWDVYCSKQVLPHLHVMNGLMQHLWCEPGQHNAPTFTDWAMVERIVKPGVVLFHRCKDGSLLHQLHERYKQNPQLLKPASQPKFVHATERHDEPKVPSRKTTAWRSWEGLRDHGRYVQRFYWQKDYVRVGFERNLPYLRDTLEVALNASNNCDIVMLTNDDTLLHPGVLQAMQAHLAKMPFGCSFRKDIQPNQVREFMEKKPPLRMPNPNNTGHDLFFWRADFLRAHFNEIPDFVLGSWKWDLILACLMRKWAGLRIDDNTVHANSTVELPFGYVLHETHQAFWSKDENLNRLESQKYNNRLYLEWISQHARELLNTLP